MIKVIIVYRQAITFRLLTTYDNVKRY